MPEVVETAVGEGDAAVIDLPDIDLPRRQAGSSPQHLLVTILGDFWVGRPEYLPSAALVDLLGDFDISPDNARATLSRLLRRGVLATMKARRQTYYRFDDLVSLEAIESIAGIMRPQWDSPSAATWTICAFSLADAPRDSRVQLRSRLRTLGFIPLYDGVWITPNPDHDAVNRELDELGILTATVFTATERPSDARPAVAAAWNLDVPLAAYEEFLAEWEDVPEKLRSGSVSPREAFVIRVLMMDGYRRAVDLDPGLDVAQLPHMWPRERARALLIECFEELTELAELRLRTIVARYSVKLSEHVHGHRVEMLERGVQGISECPKCVAREDWESTLESYLTPRD